MRENLATKWLRATHSHFENQWKNSVLTSKCCALDGCQFSFCHTLYFIWLHRFILFVRHTHTHTQNYGVNIAFFKFMFGTGLGLLQFLWLILWPIFIEQVDETCTKTYKGWPMTICFWIFCVSCLDFNISRLLRSKKDIQFTNLWRDQNKKKTNDEHKAMSKWLIDLVIANHQVS